MTKVEVFIPGQQDKGIDHKWFNTLVEAESYVLGFNSTCADGRVAFVVPIH
jgi:hypothetical protein